MTNRFVFAPPPVSDGRVNVVILLYYLIGLIKYRCIYATSDNKSLLSMKNIFEIIFDKWADFRANIPEKTKGDFLLSFAQRACNEICCNRARRSFWRICDYLRGSSGAISGQMQWKELLVWQVSVERGRGRKERFLWSTCCSKMRRARSRLRLVRCKPLVGRGCHVELDGIRSSWDLHHIRWIR